MPLVLNMPVLHRVSGTSYLFDGVLSFPRILRMLGLQYARVVNMSKVTQGSA